VAGGVEASPLPDIASVPPGQILGAAGDCMPAAREHANSTFPWARFKKNPPANACGGQGLRRRLRRAFLGTFSRFPLFSSPENPSFGDHRFRIPFFFIRIPFKIPFKFKGNSLQIQGPLFASHPQIEGPRFESFSTVIDGQAIVTHKKSGSDSFPFNSGF
jgi:hypothetical protein